MADVTCPNKSCGKTIRGVPSNRAVIVTCSTRTGGCGTRFDYPFEEISTISMRCGCDGRHITAIFKRSAATRRFAFKRTVIVSKSDQPAVPVEAEWFDAGMYDWSSFFCVACGFTPGEAEGAAVHCGKCHENVCGAQVYYERKPDGILRWFTCYPECGDSGEIKSLLKEFQATRSERANTLPVAALPSAPPTLLLPGR